MNEAYSWAEGSAFLWSGNSTTSALTKFTRGVRVGLSVNRYSYRPPFSGSRVFIEIERQATLSVTQAFSERTALTYLAAATGGQVHAHIFYLNPGTNASGGFFLYSGSLDNGSLDGTEGQGEQSLGLNATFQFWSGY